MLYIDCFQLTKACLTAQWIVIRLKLHCKSFSFVLKQVLSPRATGPKWDTAERQKRLTARQVAWCIQTQTLWLMQLFDGKSRKRVRQGERETEARGASMSLHFPWTHVRDPLLPSVWWSVAGAMSSQPGESLHGSRHKSPERSELSDFAALPPLAHVSKQLSTLCPPCLCGTTLDNSRRDSGHVHKHEEMSLLG